MKRELEYKKMYKKSIVTFIDIMGFKDFVKDSNAERINHVLEAFYKETSPFINEKYTDKENCAEVICFSDSIVRVRKIETEKNKKRPDGVLFEEFHNLVLAQGQLIDSNIIIRGGITIGDVHISEGRVFGPGLIQAYELESKYALYPRIIIDPSLIQEYKTNRLLKAERHSVEEELKYLEQLIRQGDDGMWFLDYVAALDGEFDEYKMYPIFLERHRQIILSSAKKHSKLNAVLSKFVWMANYHNQVILNLEDDVCKSHGIDKKDFLITSEDIPALQYLMP
jgi:hypothetical protein